MHNQENTQNVQPADPEVINFFHAYEIYPTHKC